MNLARYDVFALPGMASEMTNLLISLILGLWLLIVVAFYALVVWAALCHLPAGFRQTRGSFAGSGDLHPNSTAGRKRPSLPSHRLKMPTALVLLGILLLPAAGYAWSASSLIRYCSLTLLVIVPSAWILVQHFKE
jgi:hypothetical protein